jgi:hypothetical protein
LKHFQNKKHAITFMKVSDIVHFPFLCCPHLVSFWLSHGYCYRLCFAHILHYFVHWCQVQNIFFATIMESLSSFLSNSMSFHHWIKIQINQHELMLMCIFNVVHKLQMTSSNLLSIKLGHLVKPKHIVWFSKFLLTKMGGLNFFAWEGYFI